MREDAVRPESATYLEGTFAALRQAIDGDDDDRVIQIVDDVRTKVGEQSAHFVITNLLRLARNPITPAANTACIQIAMERYGARYS